MNWVTCRMIRESGRSHLDQEPRATVNGLGGGQFRDSRDNELAATTHLDRVRSGFARDMDRLSKFFDATFLSLNLDDFGDSQFFIRCMAFGHRTLCVAYCTFCWPRPHRWTMVANFMVRRHRHLEYSRVCALVDLRSGLPGNLLEGVH